jgi:hypothetical protein
MGDRAKELWARVKEKAKTFFLGSLDPPEDRYVTWFGTIVWALFLAALGIALISGLVNLWSVVDTPTPTDTETKVNFLWGLFDLEMTRETGLIALVLIAGALGSFVQASSAFVSFVGNGELKAGWVWWYGFRIFSGAVLALIVYLGIRGGLFGGQDATDEVNPYGTAGFAGLVGLFTKQALQKLQEVFETLFQTDKEFEAPDDVGTKEEIEKRREKRERERRQRSKGRD